MSATVTASRETAPGSRLLRAVLRGLAVVERAGNRLPDPFWLFWILSGVVALLSAVLAAAHVGAVFPGTHKTIVVQSLISKGGLTLALAHAVDNFAQFPPLATVLVVMFGIVVAEKSGLFETLLHRLVARAPGKYLTFALALTAMVSHVAGDAAYVTLIPLGAALYRAAGRSPVLGCVVAFVSVSAGFNASPSLTTTDVLLSSMSTAAAHVVDPHYVVSPVANYTFGLASSLLMALVITAVVETVLARRSDLEPDEPTATPGVPAAPAEPIEETTARQRRALRSTVLVALGLAALLVVAMIPTSSPLRGDHAGIVDSPVFSGMALVLGVFFALIGWVYGRLAGTFRGAPDLVAAMADGTRTMAPTIVLFFAISQFLAYFKWTNLGDILAIRGAEALRDLHLSGWLVLLGVAVLIAVMNLLVTSGSALWALVAPVLVPMLMLTGIHPETTQAMYRVADSVTKCITPMSPFFMMAVTYLRQYRKNAGIGTLASFTLPVAAVAWVAWVTFFLAWYLLGLPFGIG
ncbi:AbgT family transporter [Kitasatospora sp. LaBMicrA B282]|uniref:AbgT family transporter n=1 Tax=Kitasatospora sp. LaBMicrA B282 TaxID=3420949 RepID=UPI003D0FD2C7